LLGAFARWSARAKARSRRSEKTVTEQFFDLLNVGQPVVARGLVHDSPEELMAAVRQECQRWYEDRSFTYGEAALLYLVATALAEYPEYPTLAALIHEWEERWRKEHFGSAHQHPYHPLF
jgi:hypothetical protein